MLLTLRPEQTESVDALRAGLGAGHTRQVLVMPIGRAARLWWRPTSWSRRASAQDNEIRN